jgi:hypothetical protein
MQAKSLLLAAALIAFPAATAFAQSSAEQPASPTPDQSPGATQQTQPSSPQPNAATQAVAPVPAAPADLKPNAVVYDPAGAKVGTIESVTSAGAVVSTGTARAQIPAASFTKDAQGLVIGITKSQLEAAVAKAAAAKSG